MKARRKTKAVAERDGIAVPPDLVASELVVGARRLLVVSFPVEGSSLGHERFAELTTTEHEIALLLLEGKKNAQIAKVRRTSARTVANQVASILRKLGVASRRELLSKSARRAT